MIVASADVFTAAESARFSSGAIHEKGFDQQNFTQFSCEDGKDRLIVTW